MNFDFEISGVDLYVIPVMSSASVFTILAISAGSVGIPVSSRPIILP